jgi:outer membrane lipoprotein SlyB
VQKNDPIENSRITFRVRAIDIDGVPRSADGDVATLASLEPVQGAAGNDRTKVIGGAVVGAILGRILGGNTRSTVLGGAAGAAAGTVMARRGQTSDACLPNGAPLSLTLSRDMVVPLAGSL